MKSESGMPLRCGVRTAGDRLPSRHTLPARPPGNGHGERRAAGIAGWLVALAAIVATPVAAAPAPSGAARPITIGESHSINSAALGQLRVINVVLPAGYAKDPDKRYPVLYLIDGGVEQDLLHVAGVVQLGALWGRSAEAIVVGIETKDRRRELTGPTADPELLGRYPTAGSSALFRKFIREDVKPLIARNYRTSGQDAVLGESLAGLFIVETYLREPTLFGAYAAIDPSLWWDREALSLSAPGRIAELQRTRPIYLAQAREQSETPAAMDRVVGALKGSNVGWCMASRPDLGHATIYQQLTPEAVQFLLPPREAPPVQLGFVVKCTQRSAQQAGRLPSGKAGERP
jgi:predicted alpha/beta superfamily hydrolase